MTPTRQLPLDLPHRPALQGSDFLVAPANEVAVALIDDWANWPGARMALSGPPGSGKSHLAAVWQRASNALSLPISELDSAPRDRPLVIEDLDRLAETDDRQGAEEAVFHLINRMRAAGLPLLITGRDAPSAWPIALPDLASRLSAFPVARIGAPDDVLLSSVLVKLFADRQIRIGADVIHFLVNRMERSFDAAADLVALLDHAALCQKRPVTVPFAKAVLGWTTK